MYEEALKLNKKLGDLKAIAACNHNIGLIYQEAGNYKDALTCYEKALKISRQLKDFLGIVKSKTNKNPFLFKTRFVSFITESNRVLGIS